MFAGFPNQSPLLTMLKVKQKLKFVHDTPDCACHLINTKIAWSINSKLKGIKEKDQHKFYK